MDYVKPQLNQELEVHIKEELPKNIIKNQDKFKFFKFLIYNTKIEMHLDEFQGLLFWNSSIETITWIVGFVLFLFDPKEMFFIWILITHLIRAFIGIVSRVYLPKSSDVIDSLDHIEDQSLESIQDEMLSSYRSLLQRCEGKMKCLLKTYFILTLINIIIDIIIFCIVLSKWGQEKYECLSIIGILVVIAFIISDFSYFDWVNSMGYSFPPTILKTVKKAIFGFMSDLKNEIYNGFKGAVGKIRRSNTKEEDKA